MTTLATIRTYDELIAGFRNRAHELNIARETIDGVSGLQSGYAGKLLAPVPIRTLSRVSLGAMLGALGLKLLLVEDSESVERIKNHLTQRKRRVDPGDGIPAIRRKKNRAYLRGCEDWGKLMRARQLAIQTPEQRSKLARRANLIRWGRRKGVKRTP